MELMVIIFLFGILSWWAANYLINYRKYKLTPKTKLKSWSLFIPNDHVFESIPSIFPTFGILLTAAGIVKGLWGFNEGFSRNNIIQLLSGITFSFGATIIGLICLLVFQKSVERIKRKIEEAEVKATGTPENTNEQLIEAINNLTVTNQTISTLITQHQTDLVGLLTNGISSIQSMITESNTAIQSSSNQIVEHINSAVISLQTVQHETNQVFTNNIGEVVSKMNQGFTSLQTALQETNQVFTNSTSEVVSKMHEGFTSLQTAQQETNQVFTSSTNEVVTTMSTGFTSLQTAQHETNQVFTNSTNEIVSKMHEGFTSLQTAQQETNQVFTSSTSEVVSKMHEGFTSLQTAQQETNQVFTSSTSEVVSKMHEGFTSLQTAQQETNQIFTNNTNEVVATMNTGLSSLQSAQQETNQVFTNSTSEVVSKMQEGYQAIVSMQNNTNSNIEQLQSEFTTSSQELVGVNREILDSSLANNEIFETKFTEFISLLQENNTRGLVEVMHQVTKDFNAQMTGLIEKLVQENFSQLNESVQNLNTWQQENKENLNALTSHYKQTTELFSHSSEVLKEVAANTKLLVSDESRLNEIVQQLSKVMIDDDKFSSITNKLSQTVELVESSTKLYEETSSKLNKWVVNEYEFKQGVEILIGKLEEFKDFNSGVWESYRKEMQDAVNIIKETTNALDSSVENLNSEFYERLKATFENLDNLFLTLATKERDE